MVSDEVNPVEMVRFLPLMLRSVKVEREWVFELYGVYAMESKK